MSEYNGNEDRDQGKREGLSDALGQIGYAVTPVDWNTPGPIFCTQGLLGSQGDGNLVHPTMEDFVLENVQLLLTEGYTIEEAIATLFLIGQGAVFAAGLEG